MNSNKKKGKNHMNPKNFKDEILRELDHSLDYAKRSIDSMKSHPKWSYAFKVISDDCYSHAEQLYKMFMELCLESSKDQENYMKSIRDPLIESFASKTSLIEGYRVTYDMISVSIEPSEEGDTGDGNKTD